MTPIGVSDEDAEPTLDRDGQRWAWETTPGHRGKEKKHSRG